MKHREWQCADKCAKFRTRKEIMLRMESNLTSHMDNIQIELDTLTVTVKANENKIKDIEEGLNAQSQRHSTSGAGDHP